MDKSLKRKRIFAYSHITSSDIVINYTGKNSISEWRNLTAPNRVAKVKVSTLTHG